MSTTITSFTSFQCSIYVFTTSLLLLLPCTTIANNFQIYRSGYQRSLNDVFMTSEGVCNASSPSCHDYNANKITCNQCKCKDDKETFGYLDDSWRCFGGDAIRQNSGCFVTKRPSASNHLDVVDSTSFLYVNLSQQSECSYEYSHDTYMRTCDGKWQAVGNIGSSRYDLIVDKRTQPHLRYKYWIQVKTDVQANKVFEGQIMKLDFKCKQSGLTSWRDCFVFKEKYVTKPVQCPKSFSTASPSVTSQNTPSSVTSHPKATATSKSLTTDYNKTVEPSSTVVSSSSNSTYYGQSSKGDRIPKNVIIAVTSALGGAILIGVIVVCICCCRKRKRQDISKYTAALYDSSQDQCSAGIYAETSIRLPSTSKSLSLTSHSNPSYERGNDFSIKLTASRKLPSPSPTKSSPPRLVFSNESFEDDNGVTPGTLAQDIPRSPVKQRGNMLVKYENVTILSDVRPESVPDAEHFYDNPGDQPHSYHVLENSERVPSYAEASTTNTKENPNSLSNQVISSPRDTIPNHSAASLDDVVEQTSEDCVRKAPDEPIYANSPVLSSRRPRDKAFDFETIEPTDESHKESNNCNSYDQKEIYENSDIINSPYSHSKAIENAGYVSSNDDDDDDDACHDDGDDTNDVTHKVEPIYEKVSPVSERADHSLRHTGGSPLLRSESDDAVYQDLKSVRTNDSEYQSLTPEARRKANQKPKPKPKPKRRKK